MQAETITNDELRPRAHVNLTSIRENYRSLKSFASGSTTAAVVKANAYGHGVDHVSKALLKEDCDTFFVAYLSEAIELRESVGPIPKIVVFNGFQAEQLKVFDALNFIPVCNQMAEASALSVHKFTKPYALHFDTGMNRLGLSPTEIDALTTELPSHAPYLVMSHLACADKPDMSENLAQLEAFREIVKTFPNSKASLSATGGIYLGSDYHFDMVRPGIGLYGGGPARPQTVDLKTAITVTAPVLKLFDVQAGSAIGYGATYAPKFDSKIATVALGYADGFLRSGSNYGFGILGGFPCPIVGRISMDLIMVDVTDVPNLPRVGDHIEFIGPKAGYEIQAEALGTISYELTTRLGDRIYRTWGDEE